LGLSKKFYTADLHFGHERIIELAYRPFKTVEEMDKVLIENWNRKIGRNDLIYIIGDFGLINTSKYKEYANRLNGQKYLILGNHDRPHPEGFIGISQYHTVRDGNYKVLMFHWAIECWQGRWEKDKPDKVVIHLHGHSHGLLQTKIENRFDVGVDCWNYEPVELKEILNGI
jgi:calcineurin-like phosphoesterase family protein